MVCMSLNKVNEQVIRCRLCPRLLNYIQEVENNRPKRYREQEYWTRPVPSFGDHRAKLIVIGLAPAANGGNRTGRMFTGDSSGDWLMKAMFEIGCANKPTSISNKDGLILKNAYITSVIKCAPPLNKPENSEITNCSRFLIDELRLLEKTTKVIVTLGKIAFDTYCKIYNIRGLKFKHNNVYPINADKTLIVSYHPSRRNTNTGTLSWKMWIKVFEKAKSIIENNS